MVGGQTLHQWLDGAHSLARRDLQPCSHSSSCLGCTFQYRYRDPLMPDRVGSRRMDWAEELLERLQIVTNVSHWLSYEHVPDLLAPSVD